MISNLSAIKQMFGDTLAPNGLPVHANFAKWFGDSKVVDAQSRPLVVYHGSGASISTFGSNRNGDLLYFTRSAKNAEMYATAAADEFRDAGSYDFNGEHGGASIYPVYLSVKNLFDADNPKHLAMIPKSAAKAIRLDRGTYEYIEMFSDEIKTAGFDGTYVRENGSEDAADRDIAVFSPTQIKSATGNTGNFDPSSPHLTDVQMALPATDQRDDAPAEEERERMRA